VRALCSRFCGLALFLLIFLITSSAAFPGRAAAQTLPAQQAASTPQAQTPAPVPPAPPYDKSVFENPVPAPALAFLTQFDGSPSGALYKDRQFHHILSANIPHCMFHYGWDMSISDALHLVLTDSRVPVQIRDHRFVIVSGHAGPYLGGLGFVWIDMQDGIVLGGFYFHPTNGEPTPTVAAFSRQIKTRDNSIAISQLPPDFALDLAQWSAQSGIPPLTTRYFLTDNKRILLEHTEDYCAVSGSDASPSQPPDDCEQMNADAADIDVNAAYYLEQVDYANERNRLDDQWPRPSRLARRSRRYLPGCPRSARLPHPHDSPSRARDRHAQSHSAHPCPIAAPMCPNGNIRRRGICARCARPFLP
jgi:hypothetical protein